MSDADFSDVEEEGAITNSTVTMDSKRHARAQHNALERRRRDNIKDMYGALKDTIPGMRDERASRAAVLKKSIDLITSKQADLDRILTENRQLEEENEALEREIQRLRQTSTGQILESVSDDIIRRAKKGTAVTDANDPSRLNSYLALLNRKRPAPADDQSTALKNT